MRAVAGRTGWRNEEEGGIMLIYRVEVKDHDKHTFISEQRSLTSTSF